MNTYQLADVDGNSVGLLKTDFDEEILTKEWEDFYNNEAQVLGIDDMCEVEAFVEKMTEKYPDNLFERFFIDGVINA